MEVGSGLKGACSPAQPAPRIPEVSDQHLRVKQNAQGERGEDTVHLFGISYEKRLIREKPRIGGTLAAKL